MKMGSAGLNNFFLLNQVKGHCAGDEEGPQRATRDIFIINWWFKDAEVGRARRRGGQCV